MMQYSYQSQPQPPNLLDETRKFFTSGSGLSLLILINTGIWIVIQALRVVTFFFNDPEGGTIDLLVLHWFAIPASVPLLIWHPWTLITYNFLHLDFWHILFNMLWLFWFGKIFMEFLKTRQLITVYLLGGISGGLVYVLAFNIYPVFADILPVSFALGASASVMAVVTAISYYVPHYAINLLLIGKIRIGYLAAALFIFDFFMIPSGNAGGHIAHIGGAMFGFIYIILFRASQRAYRPFGDGKTTGGKTGSWFGSRKEYIRSKEENHQRPMSDDDYNLQRKANQERIDQILEKISKGGYESLTREEKEFLFKTSNKR